MYTPPRPCVWRIWAAQQKKSFISHLESLYGHKWVHLHFYAPVLRRIRIWLSLLNPGQEKGPDSDLDPTLHLTIFHFKTTWNKGKPNLVALSQSKKYDAKRMCQYIVLV